MTGTSRNPASARQVERPRAELALHTSAGRIALVATVAASSMASLDATIVNVALPHIGSDFHASVTQLQWVLTGYLLALASLILLGGGLGDRLGRRRIFIIGTAWFAVASLLCGLAPSIEVLIGTRVLQGIGGALLTPGSLAILQSSFRESDRAAVVGAWSGLGGVAGAIGPFVGGVLVDGPGWRWAFLLNLPIAGVAIVCARSAVPETHDRAGPGSLDIAGAGCAVLALASATWALTEAGPRGWTDASVIASAIVAAAASLVFVAHVRREPDALVPAGLFRNRTFTVVNLGTLFLYASVGLTFFLVAYELQVVAQWTAVEAGLALLPSTVLMLVFSARSGAIAQRLGPRPQLGIGPVLAGLGLFLLTRINGDTTWASDVLPGSLLFGLGMVTFVAPLTATVMAAADPDHVGIASGVNNAIARAASLGALAVVPVVSGLTSANSAGEVTRAYHVALYIAAAIAAVAGPLMFVGLGPHVRSARTLRRVHCAVDGPALQPDPARREVATVAADPRSLRAGTDEGAR